LAAEPQSRTPASNGSANPAPRDHGRPIAVPGAECRVRDNCIVIS